MLDYAVTIFNTQVLTKTLIHINNNELFVKYEEISMNVNMKEMSNRNHEFMNIAKTADVNLTAFKIVQQILMIISSVRNLQFIRINV